MFVHMRCVKEINLINQKTNKNKIKYKKMCKEFCFMVHVDSYIRLYYICKF